jgi:hypothetical protein
MVALDVLVKRTYGVLKKLKETAVQMLITAFRKNQFQ